MKPFCFRRRGNYPPFRLLMSAFLAQLCPPAQWASFIPFAGYSATPRIWHLGQGFGETVKKLPLPPYPKLEQRDNYYRPVTFLAPSPGNIPFLQGGSDHWAVTLSLKGGCFQAHFVERHWRGLPCVHSVAC